VNGPERVSVTMYQVGFGDCFLVSFHYPGGLSRDVATTSMASPNWPERPARRILTCWATRSLCSTRAHPDCPPRSTIPHHGRVPARQPRPSSTRR
jgi:hypothetical protein